MTGNAPLSNEEARELLETLGMIEAGRGKKGPAERRKVDERVVALLKELRRADIGMLPTRDDSDDLP